MNQPQVVEVQKTKESFRERIADICDDMWEKIGRYHRGVSGGALTGATADTDLTETADVLTFTLELPGMGNEDIEVVLQNNRLIVCGEKRDENEQTEVDYVFRERRYGYFERSFSLPGAVQENEVKATLDKGVLTVTVPYRANDDGSRKKIEVTTT